MLIEKIEKKEIKAQPTSLVAEKDRLLAPTEPFLPIITPETAIMMVIAQYSALTIARSAESFPKAVVEQMPIRLRLENSINANNLQTEKGRDRLKDDEYRRGGRSRGPCSACEAGQEEGHHGGRRCRRRRMLRSNLKFQQSSIKINISRLPSKTSGL